MKFREYYEENKSLVKSMMKLLDCEYWVIPTGEDSRWKYYVDKNNKDKKTLYIFTEEDEFNHFKETQKDKSIKPTFIKTKIAMVKILRCIYYLGEDFFKSIIFNNCMEINPLGIKSVFEDLLPIYYDEIQKMDGNSEENKYKKLRAFYMLPRYYYLETDTSLPLIFYAKEDKYLQLFDTEKSLVDYMEKYNPGFNYKPGIFTGKKLLTEQIDKLNLDLTHIIINGTLKSSYEDFKFNELSLLTFDFNKK